MSEHDAVQRAWAQVQREEADCAAAIAETWGLTPAEIGDDGEPDFDHDPPDPL